MSLKSLAIHICEIFAQAKCPVDKNDLSSVISIIKMTKDDQTMKKLLDLLRKIIHHGWKSSTPNCYSNFPVLSKKKNPTHAWVKRPYASFLLPSNVENVPQDFMSNNTSFSVSIWVSIQENPGATPIHLFSIGSRRLSLEMWIVANSLSIRVTTDVTPGLGKTNPIASTNYPRVFPEDTDWHNLVINCSINANALLHVEAFLDGDPAKRLVNDVLSLRSGIAPNAELTQADTTRSIHIGHLSDKSLEMNESYGYCFCQVFSTTLSRDQAMVLYLIGPSFPDLFLLSSDEESSAATSKELKSFCWQTVKQNLLKNAMIKNPSEAQCLARLRYDVTNLKVLKQSLLAFHALEHGAKLWLYPNNGCKISEKSILSLRTLSLNQSVANNGKKLNKEDGKMLIDASETSDCPLLIDDYSSSWSAAVEQSGGIGQLLLLLARMVELEKSNDKCISLALDTLLTSLENGSVHITREAHDLKIFSLICKILKHAQRKISLHTLKVILDHGTFPQSLLQYDESRDRFNFNHDFDGVIHNEKCIELVLELWDVWKHCDHKAFKCFDAILASLQACVSCNTYREANVEILKQIDLVKKLSFGMKNDLMIDDRTVQNYDANAVSAIIEVLAKMVGSPPDLHVLNELVQVALFLQDLGHCYVHHSKKSFYFNLPTVVGRFASASATWPRSSTPIKASSSSSSGAIVKSASFSQQIETNRELSLPSSSNASGKELRDNIRNVEEGKKSVDEPNKDERKLDPNRLRKVLTSSKRSHSNRRQGQKSNDLAEVSHEVHFGQLSKLETIADLVDTLPDVDMPVDSPNAIDDPNSFNQVPISPIEGILHILYGAMINMPDTSVTTVVTSIILPEYLLTLANHPNFGVRVAAIRLLFKYIQRTERVHPNGFRVEVIQGYELLATQLYNWGYSQVSPPLMDRIASSILSLIHGVEVYSTSRIPVSN